MGFVLRSDGGALVLLPGGRNTLGSGPEADIKLEGEGIAPVHLVLTVTAGRVFCQVRRPDLRFSVDGVSSTSLVLQPGVRLELGGVAFTLEGDAGASAAAGAADGKSPTISEVVHRPEVQSTLEDQLERLRQTSEAGLVARHLDVMVRLAGLVGRVEDAARFGRGLLELVLKVVPASRAFVVTFDAGGAHEVLASRPPVSAETAGPSQTILKRVWRDGISLLTHDAGQDPRLARSESITAHAIRTALCAPMLHGDELLGAIYTDGQDQRRLPTVEHLTLLESIASFAGIALSRTRLYQQLRQRDLHTNLLVHDMKNPLASVSSGLEVLEYQLTDQQGPWSKTLALIRRASSQLEGYISDILDAAELEQQFFQPRLVSAELAALAGELRDRWEPAAAFNNRRLELRLNPAGATFELDRRLIGRVLDNLIDNAMQHSPRDTIIEVTFEREQGLLRAVVRDRGPGVPEESRQRIFEKFGRATSREVGGRGFGLYFCRLAVQAHGGRIWVEGQPGDNRFVFELPEVS